MSAMATLCERFGLSMAGTIAVVPAAQIIDVVQYVKDQLQFEMLNNLSAVDYLEPDAKKAAKAGFEPHLEVLYHFSKLSLPAERLALKVHLPRDGASIASIAKHYRTADWHEREAYDLFGIQFEGHPDLRRILLNDDWVGHPMRKDYEFPLEYRDIRCQ
jgi:NADH-quinone oxidoreductase subunit C